MLYLSLMCSNPLTCTRLGPSRHECLLSPRFFQLFFFYNLEFNYVAPPDTDRTLTTIKLKPNTQHPMCQLELIRGKECTLLTVLPSILASCTST